MTLRIIRWIQRIIGVLMILYGIYLIFGTQQFFGALLIILALLIIPNLSDKKKKSPDTNHTSNKEETKEIKTSTSNSD